MRIILSMALAVACTICLAAENLVFNGDFKMVRGDQPLGWITNPHAEFVLEGGPKNKPYVRLKPSGLLRYENKFRQYNLTMVPGSKYRLSAWVRTKGFKSTHYGIVLTNMGWFKAEGLSGFPENSDWTFYKTDFVCPESTSVEAYGFVCFACDQQGVMEFTDIRMEALDEAGRKGSSPTDIALGLFRQRLVPFCGNLNAISAGDPKIGFRWFGKMKDGVKIADCYVQITEKDSAFASPEIPLVENNVFEVPLKGLELGWHTLQCRVMDRQSGKAIHERIIKARLRYIPTKEEATPCKRLNNFTCEFFNGDVVAGETVDFVLPEDGWFYMSLNNKDGKSSLKLDDAAVVTPSTPRSEAFRYLEAGRHIVEAGTHGRLVFRSIAETLSSAILEGPRMTTFPNYDWEFAKKWAAFSVTHFNRGAPSAAVLKECHEMGRIWTKNLYMADSPGKGVAQKRLKAVLDGISGADGVTADEFSYTAHALDPYISTLQNVEYDENKLIYTWCSLKPTIESVHSDFIATCLNASKGRGKVLSEVYLGTKPTEAEARKFLDEQLTEPFAVTKDFYPDMARRSGIILGNFNQIGVITVEYHPEVDYKYYLDMQLNLLANHPNFVGLGTTGYWGTHYTDEEMYRWSARLLRHYVVEGKTDMLSKTYGFTYIPGHIRNNDFDHGLDGWKVEPAAEGAVSVGFYNEFNSAIQDRWHGPNGNNFCVFKKLPGKSSRISQPVKGLVPGKKYMLLFCTADLDDVKAKRLNPRKLGIDFQLDGVKIDESMVWIDKRERGNYANNHNVARMNVNRIIFTATGESSTLSFTDAAAKDGESLVMNYIQLKPFYAPESN
ncbi:MAG: hypothetical protein IKR81_09480 [Victivallales bacterium]|nr:hypothetical protein [Victivallales bacterium]